MKKAIFSICSMNYLTKAKVLHDSLREFAIGYDVFQVLVDQPEKVSSCQFPEFPNVTMIKLSELSFAGADWQKLAFQYDVTEFNTAVKPFAFDYLFQAGYEQVIYFDPDIELYHNLAELEQLLTSYTAVVTPHITQPLPEDGHFPSNLDIIRGGQFNLGFLALARAPDTKAFIQYWIENCLKYCVFPYAGVKIFVDQLLADLIPSFVRKTKVLASEAYNMAYWNLPQRTLRIENERYYTADGPLVFFHFSGIVEDQIEKVSRHSNRIRAEQGSALYKILSSYISRCQQYRSVMNYSNKYDFNFYHNGENITIADRRHYLHLHPREKIQLGDPFYAQEKLRKMTRFVGTFQELKTLYDQSTLQQVYSTLTWRVGNFVTFPLRVFRTAIRKLRSEFKNV